MSAMILGEKLPFQREPYRLSRFGKGTTRRETLVIG
jgi:hypothetical protein